MEDYKVVEELRVLCASMVCILMKGIYEYWKFIVVFIHEECGELAVDEQGVTVVFILHKLDHL